MTIFGASKWIFKPIVNKNKMSSIKSNENIRKKEDIHNRNTGKSPRACSKYSHDTVICCMLLAGKSD